MAYDEIDWNTVWQEMNNENMRCRSFMECASIWESEEKARKYLENSKDNPERVKKVIEGLPVKPESRILDIGAGPGILAVPLARLVSHVTAVEPADGMVRVLKSYAEEEGLSNLSILQKRWEDVNPSTDLDGKYDIVIASYSLGMPDIRAAIESMCEASSKWVYLFWFAGTSDWEQAMIMLWPEMHGEEYRHGPKADVIFNVLYSMGIYPNVETSHMEHIRRFTDLQAAIDEFREHYRIETPEQEKMLSDYLNSSLKEDNGEYVLSGMSNSIKIWWEVK